MEETLIKNLISRVNSTLNHYEKDYISVKRAPYIEEPECCRSFEQFIEARFNFECFQIPELRNGIILTDGHLFRCNYIEDVDLAKRKFSIVSLVLVDPSTIINISNELLSEINNIAQFLGGTCIKFNSVKKKIKFTIE